MKNQILCLGLSRVELQTLYTRFPILHQFYQLQAEDFGDRQKIKIMVSESLCLFINPKKLSDCQLSDLIAEHEFATAHTHAAILLFTAPFTREQKYTVEGKEFHMVDLKARFDRTLRDTVEFVRKATMPCWDGLKRMEANMFNDGWYLIDLTSTGLDPTADELIAISVAYALHELVQAIYVEKPDKSSGTRQQKIRIKYNGVGFIPLEELMKKVAA